MRVLWPFLYPFNACSLQIALLPFFCSLPPAPGGVRAFHYCWSCTSFGSLNLPHFSGNCPFATPFNVIYFPRGSWLITSLSHSFLICNKRIIIVLHRAALRVGENIPACSIELGNCAINVRYFYYCL